MSLPPNCGRWAHSSKEVPYGEQNAIDGAWMKQLENASARVHISRLEALKLQLQQQAEVLYCDSFTRPEKHTNPSYM